MERDESRILDPEAGLSEVIAARIQAGDRASFDALFHRYRGKLLLLAEAHFPDWLRPRADPEDAVQEAWLRAFRQFGSFRPGGKGSFRRWIAAIVENCVIDIVRHHRAGKRWCPSGPPVPLDAPSPASTATGTGPAAGIAADGSSPSERASRAEAVDRTLVALKSLPEGQRQVFSLRYIQGLSVSETAARLKTSEAAVRMATLRAVKGLSDSLREPDRPAPEA